MSTTGTRTQDTVSPGLADSSAELSSALSASSARRNLQKLAAVILLGGSVRATKLSQVIERSVLDLPVEQEKSLLGYWHAQAIELASYLSLRRLEVRVMVDKDGMEPKLPHAHEH